MVLGLFKVLLFTNLLKFIANKKQESWRILLQMFAYHHLYESSYVHMYVYMYAYMYAYVC